MGFDTMELSNFPENEKKYKHTDIEYPPKGMKEYLSKNNNQESKSKKIEKQDLDQLENLLELDYTNKFKIDVEKIGKLFRPKSGAETFSEKYPELASFFKRLMHFMPRKNFNVKFKTATLGIRG